MFTSREHAGLWIWGETTKDGGPSGSIHAVFMPLFLIPPPTSFSLPGRLSTCTYWSAGSNLSQSRLMVWKCQLDNRGCGEAVGKGQRSLLLPHRLYGCFWPDRNAQFWTSEITAGRLKFKFLWVCSHSIGRLSLWFVCFCSNQLMNLPSEALRYVSHIFLVIKFFVAKITTLRFSCYCLTSSDHLWYSTLSCTNTLEHISRRICEKWSVVGTI